MTLRLLLLAAFAALVAYGVRHVHTLGLLPAEGEAPGPWLETVDPDSQYHARRVARALAAGGAVAGRDAALAWPSGAEGRGTPIPWPPYYDAALAALARWRPGGAEVVGAPESSPELRALAADTVARAPAWLAAMAAGLATLAAGGLVRGRISALGACAAALTAGLGVALSFAHLRYSFLGMGDHHTAVSTLHLALLFVVSAALAPRALAGTRLSAVRGAVAGLLAGAMLGTWVASLAWLVPVQACFAWLVLRPGRPAPVGLALAAASFHKAVVLAILPAVLVSPWAEERPLDVVNLSWFHVAWFGAAWLAFAPVVFFPRSPARRLPAALAGLLLIGLVLAARRGAGEALAWAAATEPFMAAITESQPFESVGVAAKWLGHGAWLGAIGFVFATFGALARKDDRLLPWALGFVPLVAAAVLQRRFAEGLAGPLAVLGALAVAAAWRRSAWLGLAACLVGVAHVGTLRATWQRWQGPAVVASEIAHGHRAVADTLAELRARPPEGRGAVLAEWDLGHAIEWWGDAPTLATNFGSYLGREAFLDPWRALFGEDDAALEALLVRRRAQFVFVTRDARRNEAAALSALGRAPLDDAAWRRTVVARLVGSDRADAAPHPACLRLVGARPVAATGMRAPWARLFERVVGADVVVGGEPGERVLLRVRVLAADGGLLWSTAGEVDGSGECRLRVPYTTSSAAAAPGGAAVAAHAELTVAGRAVPLTIREEDVVTGAEVRVAATPR